MPRFLKLLGYVSRILARQRARVTGIDIAASLIEIACAKDSEGTSAYQVADLSQPLPAYQNHFDLIASYLVLNDVYDYRGFLATLRSGDKPGGHLVLSLNNPYSYAVRGHITNYFESGKAFPIDAWRRKESRFTFINGHWRSI